MDATAPRSASSTGLKQSLGSWLLANRTARLLVGVLAINLFANVVDVVPLLGPLAELAADLGAEPIAFLLAALILERGGAGSRFTALVPFALVGVLKIGLNALNLVPQIGGFVETVSELLLDALQLWILKRAMDHGHEPAREARRDAGPGPGPVGRPVIDVTPVSGGSTSS